MSRVMQVSVVDWKYRDEDDDEDERDTVAARPKLEGNRVPVTPKREAGPRVEAARP